MKIPYTPVLFLVGIAWGYYSDKLGVVGLSCKYISSIDPVIYIKTNLGRSTDNLLTGFDL